MEKYLILNQWFNELICNQKFLFAFALLNFLDDFLYAFFNLLAESFFAFLEFLAELLFAFLNLLWVLALFYLKVPANDRFVVKLDSIWEGCLSECKFI